MDVMDGKFVPKTFDCALLIDGPFAIFDKKHSPTFSKTPPSMIPPNPCECNFSIVLM